MGASKPVIGKSRKGLRYGKAPLFHFDSEGGMGRISKRHEALLCGRSELAGDRDIHFKATYHKETGTVNCFVTNIQHQGVNTDGRCMCWCICFCGCFCAFMYPRLPTLNYK